MLLGLRRLAPPEMGLELAAIGVDRGEVVPFPGPSIWPQPLTAPIVNDNKLAKSSAALRTLRSVYHLVCLTGLV